MSEDVKEQIQESAAVPIKPEFNAETDEIVQGIMAFVREAEKKYKINLLILVKRPDFKQYNCLHSGSISSVEAIGMCEYGAKIQKDFISSKQLFDNLVQAMEARSDLVERFKNLIK